MQAAGAVEAADLGSTQIAQAELVRALMPVTDETRGILAEAAAASETQLAELRAELLAVQVGVRKAAGGRMMGEWPLMRSTSMGRT